MSNLVLNHLAPKGFLRAAINMSNFLLVTGKKSNGDPTYKSNLAKALAKIDKLIIDVITETNTDLLIKINGILVILLLNQKELKL